MENYKAVEIDKLIDFKQDIISSKVLSKNGDFMALLIALKKEQSMPEHKSDVNAFLYVIDGEIEYATKANSYKIKKDEIFFFPALEIHSVNALKDSKFLVVRI